MRAVVQRVSRAEVFVAGESVSSIRRGLLVLVGATHNDSERDARALAEKIAGLRIFGDEQGQMNRSVIDVQGEVSVVSQFTLYGDVARGRRPSFTAAASPGLARPLIESMAKMLEEAGVVVARGRFGEMMEVELVNDGPVTILLETSEGRFTRR
jgi:D-tyrosyl-tRNA(Tyr) deacylase